MRVKHAQKLLNQYHRQKGVYRKTSGLLFSWTGQGFGETEGIRQLSSFVEQLGADKHRKLTLQELLELKDIVATRWQRTKDRADHYFTNQGRDKLTNKIFRKLAVSLQSELETDSFILAPTIDDRYLDPNKKLSEQNFNNLIYFEDEGANFVIDGDFYLRQVTAKSGFFNPFDNYNNLSSAVINQFREHSTLSQLFYRLSNFVQLIFSTSISPEFLTAHQETPLVNFFENNGYLINLSLLIERFQFDKENFGYPIAEVAIDSQCLAKIIQHLTSENFKGTITPTEKQVFIESSKKHLQSQNSQLGQCFDKISSKALIELSGQKFDARLLVRSFNLETGIVNPYTLMPLSAADIEALEAHPIVGAEFQRCQNIWQAYHQDISAEHKLTFGTKHRLIDLYYSPKSQRLFDIYHSENPLQQATHDYLDGLIERQDLIGIIGQIDANTKADINIKQSLTEEEEAELKSNNNPMFASLEKAIQVLNHFGFDTLTKQTFWQLANSELNQICHNRANNYLFSSRSACAAIQSFDENPAATVRDAGEYNTMNFRKYDPKTGNYFSEYVVRRDESYGQKKGELALTSVANTFKGAFLEAFRHNMLKEFFDRYDKGGICIGEKTRNARTWTLSLTEKKVGMVQKDILELLASYQDELTGAIESKSYFYEGNSAVDFIFRRHQGESFSFTNAAGQTQQGAITRDIIAYYLAVYMADDKVTMPQKTPECFEAIAARAALTL